MNLHSFKALGLSAITILLLCFLSAWIFVQMDNPLMLLFLLWGVFFNLAAVRMKIRPLKIVLLNIGMISTLLFLVELGALIWRKTHRTPQFRRDYRADWSQEHPVLGYGPKPGSTYLVVTTRGDRVLYDVSYSFDEDGLRVSPTKRGSPSEAVLFFGGSFTLGEGVENTETFAYLIGEKTELRTLNFGFHGYGGHQMLAALQSGWVEERLRGATPVHVIYTYINSHPARVAGLVPWSSEKGPYFQVVSEGRARQNGQFFRPGTFKDNVTYKIRRLALRKLKDSFLGYRLIFTTNRDRERWAAVVNESRLEVEKRWPGASFHAISLDQSEPEEIDRRLPQRLDALEVNNLAPFQEEPFLYQEGFFIEGDGHPSSLGHRLLADYILQNIIGGGAADGPVGQGKESR